RQEAHVPVVIPVGAVDQIARVDPLHPRQEVVPAVAPALAEAELAADQERLGAAAGRQSGVVQDEPLVRQPPGADLARAERAAPLAGAGAAHGQDGEQEHAQAKLAGAAHGGEHLAVRHAHPRRARDADRVHVLLLPAHHQRDPGRAQRGDLAQPPERGPAIARVDPDREAADVRRWAPARSGPPGRPGRYCFRRFFFFEGGGSRSLTMTSSMARATASSRAALLASLRSASRTFEPTSIFTVAEPSPWIAMLRPG